MQVHNPNNVLHIIRLNNVISSVRIKVLYMYFLIIFIIYPICSSLPTSCHPFYVTHQTATSHYVLTTSSAVALLQSTNTPFLQPIRLCGTLSFVNGPVQLICFTSSFIVTFKIHLTYLKCIYRSPCFHTIHWHTPHLRFS